MTKLTDKALQQRDSERLPQEALQAYLLEQGVIDSPILDIGQYPGGASNLTYRISTANQKMILRRPPFGHKAKSAHDMQREVRVLTALSPHLDVCPTPLHYSNDEALLGSEFYLMQRIEGVIIRREMPKGLAVTEPLCEKLCQTFVEQLVQLHTLDPASVGLEDFGKPQGYVQRQVQGWLHRMSQVVTDETLDFTALKEWLEAHQPEEQGIASIIHNDYKFDNVIWCEQSMLDGEAKMIGILDWEMATLGDPLMDVGNTLAYWIQADDSGAMLKTGMMPTHLPGMMLREQVASSYLSARGWPIQSLDYYRTFGLFRLAVIVQQIYFRFVRGESDNKKFASFGQLANLLINEATKAAGLKR